MRLLVSALAAAAALFCAEGAWAQGQQQPDQEQQERARRERAREFQAPTARLEGERNAGPCPFVKVLYDAARQIDFEGGREAASAVAYTGEIQGVEADCRYREGDPIRVEVDVLFSLGKGPQATGDAKQYRWWVAVTERNRAILAKEYFALNARFPAGADRISLRQSIGQIEIPRANQQVSGANFEILVGFDVTPEMAAFNRDGKRFRVTAGEAAAAQGVSTAR